MRRLLRRLRSAGGYTLVEMLLTMSILGVVMGGLTALFVSASNAELDMNLRWQAQQNARLAVDKLRREIHCASSVTTGSAQTPAGPLSTYTVTVALPAACSGGGINVTWCTQSIGGATNRWGLYRVANSSTCSGGIKYADYLTYPNVFGYTATSGSLGKVNVDIKVDRKPTNPREGYELKDDIVLRNSVRS